MLSSIPVTWRMIASSLGPILGLLVFTFVIGTGQINNAQSMDKVAQSTEFTRDLSNLVHQLQRERGRSAGFVGSNGATSYRTALEAQRTQTDQALQAYLTAQTQIASILTSDEYQRHLRDIEQDLVGLQAHRDQVDTLTLPLGQTVAPYTQTISHMLLIVSDLAHLGKSSELSSRMVALLNLMSAKENAGIERAIGANIFASQSIDAQRHQRALNLISRQQAYLDEFVSLMGPDWGQRLDAMNQRPESQAVFTARETLIEAGYGGPVSAYSGADWFNLTTDRIELMMELETALASNILSLATDGRDQAQQQAFWLIASSLAGVLLALLFNILLVMSVVRPLASITTALDEISKGVTGVHISGTKRGDEIGLLARTATAFQQTTEDRETAIRERGEAEKQAMQDRRAVMSEMAQQVQSATSETVGQVASEAERLQATSHKVSEALDNAGHKAGNVSTSTDETLERTQRAAELAQELSSAIGEVTEQITRGDSLAQDAKERANRSRSSVEELNEAAHQISDFIGLINDLAEQTNLLALNATIEAARAGDAGKGFAVVASEVKALAAQTNTSTTQIAERVNQIQSRTQSTVDTMTSISDAIDQIGEVTANVAAAMEEQRSSTGAFTNFVEENAQSMSTMRDSIKALVDITGTAGDQAQSMAHSVKSMSNAAQDACVSIPRIVNEAVDKAEQRSTPRAKTNQPIQIIFEGQTIRAELKDISSSGIGMTLKAPKLPIGTQISIQHSLFEAKAEVAWADGVDVGLSLLEPLPQRVLDSLNQSGVRAA